LNTRLPKLYFADAANLLLQYNLKRIEPLSPRGMSGQDKQGSMEFRGEEEIMFYLYPVSIKKFEAGTIKHLPGNSSIFSAVWVI
jgi:hypothetical protein